MNIMGDGLYGPYTNRVTDKLDNLISSTQELQEIFREMKSILTELNNLEKPQPLKIADGNNTATYNTDTKYKVTSL